MGKMTGEEEEATQPMGEIGKKKERKVEKKQKSRREMMFEGKR